MFDMVKSLLFRLQMTPVVAWSLSAFAISVGYAVHDRQSSHVHWEMFAILLVSCLLVQGVVARSFERMPGRVPNTLLRRAIPVLGLLGAGTAIGFGIYVAKNTAGSMWLCTLAVVWLLLSYSAHPFRNIPFLAEWVTAFPAMVAFTLGSYFLLSDMWEPGVGWAALLHGLLSVSWLMQVHLRDVAVRGRKQAREPLTTVAWVAQKFGKQAARHVPAGYFLLTAFVGTMATLQVAHVFFFTVLCALLGAFSAWNTNPVKSRKLTETQGKMIVMTLAHGILLSLWVAWM